MKFTFGIITSRESNVFLPDIIKSIYQQMMDEFEIVVVGGDKIVGNNIKHIEFNDAPKPKWITRKKNIITENARYENIVYLHDYIKFLPKWYNSFREFGSDWDICMNKILNKDGSRFRDWCVWYDKTLSLRNGHNGGCGVKSNIIDRVLVPYDYINTDNMYISGAYFIAKKYVMQECPFDENLIWGKGEDVKWSEEVLLNKKYRYKMNTNSVVQLMKQKDVCARPYPRD